MTSPENSKTNSSADPHVKLCGKCGETKPATEQFFHRRGGTFKAWCKPCRSEERRAKYAANPQRELSVNAAWAAMNPERASERSKRWREVNAEREAERHRKRYAANPARTLENGRRWRAANPERSRELCRRWRAANLEKATRLRREQSRKRLRDPQYRLHLAICRALQKCLKGKKGAKRTFALLGYGPDDLKAHLERSFQSGMTWENYGSGWHLDHRLPQSSFSFRTEEDADFKACWALSNLQPLWAQDNLTKSNKRIYLI